MTARRLLPSPPASGALADGCVAQVFLTTPRSFALVNLKPLVPGHVLVCPRVAHRRHTDLSADETADLWATVQLAQRLLARTYFGDGGERAAEGATPRDGSFTVAIQDGPAAGQTVPHLHVHVLPRADGDMGASVPSDDVYVRLAAEAGNVGGALWDRDARPAPGGGLPRVDDADQPARTPEQMHDEAERYRATLRDMGAE